MDIIKNEFGIDYVKGDKSIILARDERGQKFVLQDEFSIESFKVFMNDLQAGLLEPYQKSEPIPEDNSGPVKVAVAKNFVMFYKLFGYPTGVGALLVKNDSAHVLKKVYYGRRTVDVVLSSKMQRVKRDCLHQRFEDGTISFLTILSLQHGFKILSDISMQQISTHVFSLARYLHHSLLDTCTRCKM